MHAARARAGDTVRAEVQVLREIHDLRRAARFEAILAGQRLQLQAGAWLVAVLAALPWRRLRAATGGGWRTVEVTTRAEISRPQGVTRAWLPLPLAADTEWQRTAGNSWTGNAARIETKRVGKYGVPLLYAE